MVLTILSSIGFAYYVVTFLNTRRVYQPKRDINVRSDKKISIIIRKKK